MAKGPPTVKLNRVLIKGMEQITSVKFLGLESITFLRLIKKVFIVVLPLWQSLDCSFPSLSNKETPLDSSIMIAMNLG